MIIIITLYLLLCLLYYVYIVYSVFLLLLCINSSLFLLYYACLYVCMYGGYSCFLFLFYSSVCVLNIWTQCMVCMYLIDVYCCDTGWIDCIAMGIYDRSHCNGRAIATARSWCVCNQRGKECIVVVLYCNSSTTTVVYWTQQQ